MFPVPVTIVSGFLGAGKTTLINRLLQNNAGERVAVIENEFGEVNIDKALLTQNNSNVQVIELGGGCVCCSIRGELSQSLKTLAAKMVTGELLADRFILETTGVADPAPIIQTFFTDEEIREKFMLDAVVTLADAVHIEKQLDEHRVASSQIGFADRVIVTKADLVDPSALNDTYNRINAINNKAEIWQATHGVIEKNAWLGINAFQLNESVPIQEGFYIADIDPASHSKPVSKFARFGARKNHAHSYSDGIRSFVLEGESCDLQKLDTFLEDTVAIYGNDMLRYKGILSVKDEPRRLLLQGVHKVVGLDYGTEWGDKEERKSIIVIIGRNLPQEKIITMFRTCF